VLVCGRSSFSFDEKKKQKKTELSLKSKIYPNASFSAIYSLKMTPLVFCRPLTFRSEAKYRKPARRDLLSEWKNNKKERQLTLALLNLWFISRRGSSS
jgi:hypothetical protein